MQKQNNTLDNNLNKRRDPINLSSFSYLFSEII